MANTYTRNQRILAHMVLNFIMSSSVVVRKHGMNDAEKGIYMSKGYFRPSILRIKEAIENKSLDEILSACRMLKENGHVIFEEYDVDVTLSKVEIIKQGEEAYHSEFYLELNKNDAIDRKVKWPLIYWWFIPLLTLILGFVIDELKSSKSEAKTEQKSNQSTPAIPTSTDSLKNHKIR